jgi:hypothetical protein
MYVSVKPRCRTQWVIVGVAALLSLHFAGRDAVADLTVLFTASTDYTGATPNLDGSYGYAYPNDPINQNPYIPAISAGVTLSQATGGFDGNSVGPLPDGSTYGPFGYNGNAGGSTGWVTTSYVLPTSGTYQLVWEVANTINCAGADALATDNIAINGSSIFTFSNGGVGALPSGFSGLGNYGTSGAVNDLPPSGGSGAFAYMDVQPPPSSTNVAPIFDTVDGYSASRIYSATFTANANDVLTLDVAFLTSDGSPYDDYGVVALQSVPEPSSLVMAVIGTLGMVGYALRRSRNKAGCC